MKNKLYFIILNLIILSVLFMGCTYSTLDTSKHLTFNANDNKNSEIAMFNEDIVDQNQEVVKVNKAIIAFQKVHDIIFNMNLQNKESINSTKEAIKPLIHKNIQKEVFAKIDEFAKSNHKTVYYDGIEIHEMHDVTGFKVDGENKKAFYITYSIKAPRIDDMFLDSIKSDGLVIIENNEFKVISLIGI